MNADPRQLRQRDELRLITLRQNAEERPFFEDAPVHQYVFYAPARPMRVLKRARALKGGDPILTPQVTQDSQGMLFLKSKRALRCGTRIEVDAGRAGLAVGVIHGFREILV